jgi:hypothetical protein
MQPALLVGQFLVAFLALECDATAFRPPVMAKEKKKPAIRYIPFQGYHGAYRPPIFYFRAFCLFALALAPFCHAEIRSVAVCVWSVLLAYNDAKGYGVMLRKLKPSSGMLQTQRRVIEG